MQSFSSLSGEGIKEGIKDIEGKIYNTVTFGRYSLNEINTITSEEPESYLKMNLITKTQYQSYKEKSTLYEASANITAYTGAIGFFAIIISLMYFVYIKINKYYRIAVK